MTPFEPPAGRVAILPGSFDPLTNGHVDIILRSAHLFERIVVSVLLNSEKTPLFSSEERIAIIREVFREYPNIEVDAFDGLLVAHARHHRASANNDAVADSNARHDDGIDPHKHIIPNLYPRISEATPPPIAHNPSTPIVRNEAYARCNRHPVPDGDQPRLATEVPRVDPAAETHSDADESSGIGATSHGEQVCVRKRMKESPPESI